MLVVTAALLSITRLLHDKNKRRREEDAQSILSSICDSMDNCGDGVWRCMRRSPSPPESLIFHLDCFSLCSLVPQMYFWPHFCIFSLFLSVLLHYHGGFNLSTKNFSRDAALHLLPSPYFPPTVPS
jgi:hypothetical protein